MNVEQLKNQIQRSLYEIDPSLHYHNNNTNVIKMKNCFCKINRYRWLNMNGKQKHLKTDYLLWKMSDSQQQNHLCVTVCCMISSSVAKTMPDITFYIYIFHLNYFLQLISFQVSSMSTRIFSIKITLKQPLTNLSTFFN